jgi:DNA-binding beta-propeller fold protein YncE
VDVAVAKLNAAGTVQWAKRWGGTDIDWPHGLAVDRNGDVVVVGEYWTATDLGGGTRISRGASDIFVAKYSGVDGSYRWDRTYGGGGMDKGSGVAIDPATGNVFVTGGFTGPMTLGTSTIQGGSFLAGFGSAGNNLWAEGFGSASPNDFGLAVALDGNGHLTLAGQVYSASIDFGGGWLIGNGNPDLYVANFSLVGNSPPTYRWATRSGAGVNGISVANAVAMDAQGQALVGGSFQMTVDFGGLLETAAPTTSVAFVARYGP